jgi:uridine phosphorylase
MGARPLAAGVPVPQHSAKHREPSLFTAADFQRYADSRSGRDRVRAPENIVLVFGRRWSRFLRRTYPAADPRTGVIPARRSVGIAHLLGPGAPYAAIVVEELAARGARRFVIVGIAGSIQPTLAEGSIVVCTRALRDEGTSHHYARAGGFAMPSARLTSRLRAALGRAGLPVTEGGSWTIDAIYRETLSEVRRYRRMGLLTVEMEASALFSVARYLGAEAAAVFVVSDLLDETGWKPRFHATPAGLRRALSVCVETLGSTARR